MTQIDVDLDAVIAHTLGDTIWLNDGSGIFTPTDQFLGRSYTTAVGLSDLDSDGDLDAPTAGQNDPGKV